MRSRPFVRNDVWSIDRPTVEDGKLVVWMENQGVWEWAVDQDADDPDVYDRKNEDDEPWQPTGPRLSDFLVHVAVFETIMNPDHGAGVSGIGRNQCQDILTPLKPIPNTRWRWPGPGSSLYAGDGLLALAGPTDPDDQPDEAHPWGLFLAARDHTGVDYLTRLPHIQWDWRCWDQHS
jgi:hypothetical protein